MNATEEYPIPFLHEDNMKAFSQQLPAISAGALDEDLTQALADGVEFLDANGGTFEITLKLKLSQVINRAGVMIKVTHDVQTKFPKPKPAEFTMFLGPDGDLELENPRQGNLPFKEVRTEQPKPEVIPAFSKKAAPIIVNKETGEIQS